LRLDGEVAWLTEQAGGVQVGVRFQRLSGPLLRTLAELLEAAAFG
jgi:hypothetical protein